MKVIFLKGLPASGKTTKAKEIISNGGDFFRINRDCLREMLHCGKWTGKRERVTIDVAKMVARSLLTQGKNIIIDDTNLTSKHWQSWRDLAKEFDAKWEEFDFTDVSYPRRLRAMHHST